jgi:hypothetical protein
MQNGSDPTQYRTDTWLLIQIRDRCRRLFQQQHDHLKQLERQTPKQQAAREKQKAVSAGK